MDGLQLVDVIGKPQVCDFGGGKGLGEMSFQLVIAPTEHLRYVLDHQGVRYLQTDLSKPGGRKAG